jgi:hypothetical protein
MFFVTVVCAVCAFVIAAENSTLDSIGVAAGGGRGRPTEPGGGGGSWKPGRGYPIGSPHHSPSDGSGGRVDANIMFLIMAGLIVFATVGYLLWMGCCALPQKDEEQQQALMSDKQRRAK